MSVLGTQFGALIEELESGATPRELARTVGKVQLNDENIMVLAVHPDSVLTRLGLVYAARLFDDAPFKVFTAWATGPQQVSVEPTGQTGAWHRESLLTYLA